MPVNADALVGKRVIKELLEATSTPKIKAVLALNLRELKEVGCAPNES